MDDTTRKKLWKQYSRARREAVAINKMVSCYTCATTVHINIMDLGHYIDRRFLPTMFDERNTKPQCQQCNRYKDGNLKVFNRELRKEYGEGIIEELEDLSRSNDYPTKEGVKLLIKTIQNGE